MPSSARQHPVLLIATEGEWAGRSLESVLQMHGYEVVRAEDGRDAIGRTLQRRPDAIIIDEHLPGIGGIEVCELLREEPTFDPATPIVVTAAAPAPRAVRVAAYRAGAWEFCTQPLDIDTLLLQLGTFLRAKRALVEHRDRQRSEDASGVVTSSEMQQWAEKLAARASRNHESLACVVFGPVAASQATAASATEQQRDTDFTTDEVVRFTRDIFRRSDVVGRTSDGRLALLAPETDEDGVRGLLDRLRAAVSSTSMVASPSRPEFRAGYWAVQDFASSPLEPAELMRRAMQAHEHARRTPNDNLTIGFYQRPVS